MLRDSTTAYFIGVGWRDRCPEVLDGYAGGRSTRSHCLGVIIGFRLGALFTTVDEFSGYVRVCSSFAGILCIPQLRKDNSRVSAVEFGV